METEKLYDSDPFLHRFAARVLHCEAGKNGSVVILDHTAFYPEGGGQPADHGTLGGVTVTDVHEKDGIILHTCSAPLPVGETVEGMLDRERRLDHMQAHSGEHIVSGLIHTLYGYDNVGFHMGADCVTIDFDGPMTPEDLIRVETLANRYIWEDHEVEILFPTAAQLEALEYRSKKALTGSVRIVRFPGADTCACCGTHVLRAGQVGLVKLLSVQPFRNGARIEMLSGRKALAFLSENREQNKGISQLLSVKSHETAAAVERLKEELAQTRLRLTQMENEDFARQADAFRGQGDLLLFRDAMSPDALRRFTDLLAAVCGGRAAVFSGQDGDWKYAVAQRDGDLREFTKQMNAQLGGRGGGKPDFVQGGLTAEKAAIQAFFQ